MDTENTNAKEYINLDNTIVGRGKNGKMDFFPIRLLRNLGVNVEQFPVADFGSARMNQYALMSLFQGKTKIEDLLQRTELFTLPDFVDSFQDAVVVGILNE